jgi:hypothetical protein
MINFTKACLLSVAATMVQADDCSFFYDLGCSSGDVTTNPADWAERSFQTWLPGSEHYKEEYEGLGRIMCYNNYTYASDRQSATVEARCRTHKSVTEVQYNWNGEGFQSESTYQASSALGDDALTLTAKAIDGDGKEFTVTMEAINFAW